MIYIQKNQLNKIILTLCETSRLGNPFYLFEFKNEYQLDSTPFYWSATNQSTNKIRYDLFYLTESPTGSTTGGTNVALSLVSGQYKYNIYESQFPTLKVANTTGVILETGRMVVGTNFDDTISSGTSSVYL